MVEGSFHFWYFDGMDNTMARRKGVMHFCCMTGEGSKEALPFPLANQDLLGEKEGIWSNQKFVVAIASLEVDLGYHRESGVSSLTTHTI